MKKLPKGLTVFESFTDLIQANIPHPAWLIQDILPGVGVNLLCGKPRAGKSCLMIQIALALSNGAPFLGKYPTKKVGVMVIQADCHERIWQEQVKSITYDLGVQTDNVQTVIAPRNWMGQPKAVEDVNHAIVAYAPGLVVFDALASTVAPSMDINTAQGVASFLERIDKLRNGRVALCLHHENKDPEKSGSDKIAGFYGLTAGSEAFMRLQRDKEGNGGKLMVDTRSGKPVVTMEQVEATWHLAVKKPPKPMVKASW